MKAFSINTLLALAAMIIMSATYTPAALAQDTDDENAELAKYIQAAKLEPKTAAAFKLKEYPIVENELEWNEFKTKTTLAQIIKNSLTIQNKNKAGALVYSYTDLPINTSGNFLVIAQVNVPKFEKDHPYAMFINMEDALNTGVIYFDCETVRYVQIKDGKLGAEQSAIINGKKRKNAVVTLTVKKDAGKVTIGVNGDECLKLRKIDYKNTGFGFGVMPNDEIQVLGVACGSKIIKNDD